MVSKGQGFVTLFANLMQQSRIYRQQAMSEICTMFPIIFLFSIFSFAIALDAKSRA
ncbi:hypothetical protein [Leisingera sp. M658]|uniref:hypothetical protein n=1 Tax=Leisingera sp. M658 TaxID=2867015 RepID=UPI0021A67E19|nr:hypothetical protein [Leisingera sp. M658]UWQ77435.1 hypothetical protein K3724_22920 [Leisingera sp. M658]